jgi:diguanylate cyclase (GGDEF)-like protein/PAS domain S-box-containing protein
MPTSARKTPHPDPPPQGGRGISQREGRIFQVAVVLATITVVSAFLWDVFQYGGATVVEAADDVYSTGVPVAAAVACVLASWGRQGRARVSWLLLGASAFVWGMGSATWFYYDVVTQQAVPFPSLADAGFLLAVPFAVAGLMLFPSASSRTTSQLRTLLDGAIIAGALLFVSWAIVLGPSYSQATGSVMEKAIGLAYPFTDVIMGSIVLLLLPRASRSSRITLLLVGGGILANTVSDTVFTYLQLANTYSGVSNAIDAGWVLGYAMVGLGALWAAGRPSSIRQEDERISRANAFVPYGPVAVAGAIAVTEIARSGAMEPFLLWDGLFVVIVLVGRQLLTIMEDLTLNHTLEARVERRTAELAQREERFRALVQNSSDAITITDAQLRIQYQSPSIERIFGYQPLDVMNRRLSELIHEDDRAAMHTLFDNMAARPGAIAHLEARWLHQNGSWRQSEMAISNLLEEPAVKGLVINTRDITDRKALEEQLAHQAFHDSLTGIANRALFKDRLQQSLARAARRQEKPAILYLDLDGFKTVNDSLGHASGDELLAAVAARLRPYVRTGDTMARLGGDEFAILLEDTEDLSAPITVAGRIIEALKEPFLLGPREIVISASIGIAALAQETPDELLRNADIAMYMAKSAGKGRYEVFKPAMHEAVVTQMQLEADLKRAVERGEFFLVYQPLVSLRDQRPTGVEALVRWRHPERGLVLPMTFIPLAEKTGGIVAIGRWVLREACRQMQEWRQIEPDLKVSVNLSGRQMRDPGLVTDVAEALRDTGLPAHALTLEMTESVLMDDIEGALRTLRALKALGLQLAIDDFGTGYSSLSYLGKFPVDSLKIDRSFVSGPDASDNQPLVATIMEMGRSLKLEVVAEGIERPEQLTELQRLECQVGQGYYFAKPMLGAEMEAYLRNATAEQVA